MSKRFWSSEKIMSVSAILISLGTFFSIVYQNRLLTKQQSAAVLPYLEIWNSQNTDRYQLILMNNGIGPAFIRDIRVKYQDSTYQYDPYGFFVKVIKPTDTSMNNVYYSNILPGRLIPAGERIDMIGIKNSDTVAKKLSSYFANDDVVSVEIVYESVYGKSWLAYGIANEPIEMN